jgi:hypothetical protein
MGRFICGRNSVGRVPASQAGGRRFEPGRPLKRVELIAVRRTSIEALGGFKSAAVSEIDWAALSAGKVDDLTCELLPEQRSCARQPGFDGADCTTQHLRDLCLCEALVVEQNHLSCVRRERLEGFLDFGAE